MQNKKSFILYTDVYEVIKDFTSEQKAQLLDAIFQYHLGEQPQLDSMTNVAFLFIKQQFIRDEKKYEEIKERNKKNGLNGGRPSKPKEPTGFSENPKNPSEPKKADNGTDTVTDNDIGTGSITPFTPQGGETDDDFEQFWISFPRQRRGDKQVAQSKWNAALKKGYTVDQIMQGVINYQHSREVAEFYAMNAASWLHNAKFLDNYRPPKNKAPEVNKWDEAREKIKRGEL